MPTLQNPLRRPKPARADVVFSGTFNVADGRARYVSSAEVYTVRLTPDELWLGRELSIPLACLRSVEVVTRGRAIRRRALRIVYRNPITEADEAAWLCKPMVLWYRAAPLEALREHIEEQRASLADRGFGLVDSGLEFDGPRGDAVELRCEVCGAAPAYYVGYRLMLGALFFSWVTTERRRTHCRWHNLLAGGWAWCVTAATGWLGWSIVVWPAGVLRSSLDLRPALGRLVYPLAILPVVLLVVGVWLYGSLPG